MNPHPLALAIIGLFSSAGFASAQTDMIRADSTNILVHPIGHASMVLQAGPKTLFVDPVGDPETFDLFGPPDLILVTHAHRDHLNADLIGAVTSQKTTIVAPKVVYDKLPLAERAQTKVLGNGDSIQVAGVAILAIPAYNLTPARKKFHPKGEGNGYVMTLAGRRIYISGDTEDIPEMRALRNIDAAFVCMNLPYTMDVEQAASAVLAFKPRVVYPYHYRGTDGMSDVAKFKQLVSKDPSIEVRQLDWYAEANDR